jgi:hypothetical protein
MLDVVFALAQGAPPTDSVKSVLAWVVAGLIGAFLATLAYHLKVLKDHKVELVELRAEHRGEQVVLNQKLESVQERMLKLSLRVVRALEIVAGVDEAEVFLEEDSE